MNHELTQAVITILAVINPVITASLFVEATSGLPRSQRVALVARTVIVVAAILVVSALVGQPLLHMFGISLDAFRVVGGVIVAYLGLLMLAGKSLAPESTGDKPGGRLVPVIAFAASPGTIATVVTLSVVHTPHEVPLTALIGSIIAVALTTVVIVVALFAGGRIKGGAQEVTTRFMGLIVVSMGVQFLLAGLKAFFVGGR